MNFSFQQNKIGWIPLPNRPWTSGCLQSNGAKLPLMNWNFQYFSRALDHWNNFQATCSLSSDLINGAPVTHSKQETVFWNKTCFFLLNCTSLSPIFQNHTFKELRPHYIWKRLRQQFKNHAALWLSLGLGFYIYRVKSKSSPPHSEHMITSGWRDANTLCQFKKTFLPPQ